MRGDVLNRRTVLRGALVAGGAMATLGGNCLSRAQEQ